MLELLGCVLDNNRSYLKEGPSVGSFHRGDWLRLCSSIPPTHTDQRKRLPVTEEEAHRDPSGLLPQSCQVMGEVRKQQLPGELSQQ